VLDRHDLTDEEWARLEPLLPSQKPQRGGRWADHRTVINGVFWRTRCGLPWRDVPPNYGPWKTVASRSPSYAYCPKANDYYISGGLDIQ